LTFFSKPAYWSGHETVFIFFRLLLNRSETFPKRKEEKFTGVRNNYLRQGSRPY
jgi:hypothetical protein